MTALEGPKLKSRLRACDALLNCALRCSDLRQIVAWIRIPRLNVNKTWKLFMKSLHGSCAIALLSRGDHPFLIVIERFKSWTKFRHFSYSESKKDQEFRKLKKFWTKFRTWIFQSHKEGAVSPRKQCYSATSMSTAFFIKEETDLAQICCIHCSEARKLGVCMKGKPSISH